MAFTVIIGATLFFMAFSLFKIPSVNSNAFDDHTGLIRLLSPTLNMFFFLTNIWTKHFLHLNPKQQQYVPGEQPGVVKIYRYSGNTQGVY